MGFLLNKGSERQKEMLSVLKFCTEQALNGNFWVLFLVLFYFFKRQKGEMCCGCCFSVWSAQLWIPIGGLIQGLFHHRCQVQFPRTEHLPQGPCSCESSFVGTTLPIVQREKLRNRNSSRIQELAFGELPLWRGFCVCFLALVSICISHIIFILLDYRKLGSGK